MGQTIGMEDSHTPMYHFIAPAKDDPYVHIAPVAFVHDFMILHVPLLCYPYAPISYEGYRPLIPEGCNFGSSSCLLASAYCAKLEWGSLRWKVELNAEFQV